MSENSEYVKDIFRIERENTDKVRKDIAKWSDIKNEILYFFDNQFNPNYEILSSYEKQDIKNIVNDFIVGFDMDDDKQTWFEKIKVLTDKNGFCSNMKEFKKNKEAYKGSVADVTKIIRILLTGREQSPDIHSIMQVMGKERTVSRLSKF
ncbi:MAG: glutamyl-tRNA synthetase [Alphaproteobacteria bacterium ADurb.Bin438]|nr:MAG: glutamyl-tRNA synthetase [Alphaproteobacteria bacterium ADurb.Bin438]